MRFVDAGTEVVRISSERDVHKFKELIHTRDHALGRRAEGALGWLSVEQDDLVSQVSGHDKVVLDDERGAF